MPQLKQVYRFASLNHNIHNTADSTPVDIDHDAHVVDSANPNDPPTLKVELKRMPATHVGWVS